MSPAQATPEVFARVPANRFFGFSLDRMDTRTAEVSLIPTTDHVQEEGIVHGGVTTALADTAAVYALYPTIGSDNGMTSIELKLNFLRPVRVGEGVLTATARVVKQGKTVALCDVEVHQKDRIVAKGLFTYLIRPPNAGA